MPKKPPEFILGVDPGLDGALAFINPARATLEVIDMPIYFPKVKSNKRVIDIFSLAGIFEDRVILHTIIELVASSPQMGVVSAFTFGMGYGAIHGIIAANRIPNTPVSPQKWKGEMRVPADKKLAVARACNLLPKCSDAFKGPKGGVKDGRAEASILALYGCLIHNFAFGKPVTLV